MYLDSSQAILLDHYNNQFSGEISIDYLLFRSLQAPLVELILPSLVLVLIHLIPIVIGVEQADPLLSPPGTTITWKSPHIFDLSLVLQYYLQTFV